MPFARLDIRKKNDKLASLFLPLLSSSSVAYVSESSLKTLEYCCVDSLPNDFPNLPDIIIVASFSKHYENYLINTFHTLVAHIRMVILSYHIPILSFINNRTNEIICRIE
jgi:hypothetical protein